MTESQAHGGGGDGLNLRSHPLLCNRCLFSHLGMLLTYPPPTWVLNPAPIAHYALFAGHSSLHTAHYSLNAAHLSLPTANYSRSTRLVFSFHPRQFPPCRLLPKGTFEHCCLTAHFRSSFTSRPFLSVYLYLSVCLFFFHYLSSSTYFSFTVHRQPPCVLHPFSPAFHLPPTLDHPSLLTHFHLPFISYPFSPTLRPLPPTSDHFSFSIHFRPPSVSALHPLASTFPSASTSEHFSPSVHFLSTLRPPPTSEHLSCCSPPPLPPHHPNSYWFLPVKTQSIQRPLFRETFS